MFHLPQRRGNRAADVKNLVLEKVDEEKMKKSMNVDKKVATNDIVRPIPNLHQVMIGKKTMSFEFGAVMFMDKKIVVEAKNSRYYSVKPHCRVGL